MPVISSPSWRQNNDFRENHTVKALREATDSDKTPHALQARRHFVDIDLREHPTMANYQYAYVMKNLSKTFPGGKEVLKGITLQFFPDAKIGVLGHNGAGKSTLMKIMAGIDTEFNGEAWAAEGIKVGYLEQEPQLDASKTVG